LPNGKEFRAPGLPIEINHTAVCDVADVPRLGQHTEAILREIGCSEEQVRAAMAT